MGRGEGERGWCLNVLDYTLSSFDLSWPCPARCISSRPVALAGGRRGLFGKTTNRAGDTQGVWREAAASARPVWCAADARHVLLLGGGGGGAAVRAAQVLVMAASHGAAAVSVGWPPSVWAQEREPTKLASSGFRHARDRQPPLTRLVRAPLATPFGEGLADAQRRAARSVGTRRGPVGAHAGARGGKSAQMWRKQCKQHLTVVQEVTPDRAQQSQVSACSKEDERNRKNKK